MRPLGDQLGEYGFSWPELLREFLSLGIIIVPIVAVMLTNNEGESSAMLAQLLLLGWVIAFFATGIYFSRQPKIVVYQNGIGLKERDDEKTWNWNQISRWDGQRTTQRVNGIPLFRYGANHFYARDEKIFSVGTHRARAEQLANLIILKICVTSGTPNDYDAYERGSTVQYQGVKVNRNGLGGNKQSVRWDEVDQIDFKDGHLRVKRHDDTKLRKFGYVGTVAGYSLMGLLDRVRGTHFADETMMQLARSRGQIWGAQAKQTAMILLIVTPVVIGVVAFMWYADQQGQQRYAGLRALTAQYNPQVASACSESTYESYEHGDSKLRDQKFLIIDAMETENPHVHDTLQTALPEEEQANSAAELTTIVCFWSDALFVSNCDYGDTARKRYRQEYVMSIIDVKRKTIVSEDYIEGSMPDRCPSKDPGDDVYGEYPTEAEFTEWLYKASAPAGKKPNPSGSKA